MDIRKLIAQFGLVIFKRYYSKYEGYVVSNEDPEVLGRLRVRVPKVWGDAEPETWAWPSGVPAGHGMGFYQPPEKDDVVWVEFKEGDARFPIWSYGWWGKGDMIKTVADRGKRPQTATWQSASGLRIELDDKNGLIRLTQGGKRVLEINKQGISVGSKTKSAEPGVMGDKNADVLNELQAKLQELDEKCQQYATTQQAAIATVPLLIPLAAGYVTFLTETTALLAEIIKIAAKIPATKSTVLTID